MASSSNFDKYDGFGNGLRRDSAVSAVSDISASRSSPGGAEMYRYQRPQRTLSDTTIKRPLRLSNAHKRRVSTASINSPNSNNTTIQPGQLIQSMNTSAVVEDNGFPSDLTPTEYDTPFTTPSDITCFCCNIPNPSHSHDDEYPEKCWEHQVCLTRGGWKKHLERFQHTSCPLTDCSKSGSDLGTQEKFVKHWLKRHEEKCWYWGKKKTIFGSEKAVWLRWNGD